VVARERQIVSRRSTPQRIDAARDAATRNRLIGEGVAETTADAWIAGRKAQAAEDGLDCGSAYWPGRLGRIAARQERQVRL
jgi:hypothetical protein